MTVSAINWIRVYMTATVIRMPVIIKRGET